jgi:hypothetical protein
MMIMMMMARWERGNPVLRLSRFEYNLDFCEEATLKAEN